MTIVEFSAWSDAIYVRLLTAARKALKGDSFAADDVVQETILKLLQKREKLSLALRPDAYAFSALRSAIADFYRSRAKCTPLPDNCTAPAPDEVEEPPNFDQLERDVVHAIFWLTLPELRVVLAKIQADGHRRVAIDAYGQKYDAHLNRACKKLEDLPPDQRQALMRLGAARLERMLSDRIGALGGSTPEAGGHQS